MTRKEKGKSGRMHLMGVHGVAKIFESGVTRTCGMGYKEASSQASAPLERTLKFLSAARTRRPCRAERQDTRTRKKKNGFFCDFNKLDGDKLGPFFKP
jgi:hypothetical protein